MPEILTYLYFFIFLLPPSPCHRQKYVELLRRPLDLSNSPKF